MATVVSSPVARRQSPLALWHLLSLDAPSVAIVWTAFLAHLRRIALPWQALAALGLAVWIIYIADRILDGRRPSRHLEERHWFHARHRTPLLLLVAVALPLLAALVWRLPFPLRLLWPALGLPVAVYASAVHAFRLPHLPKEHLVSLLFALACILPGALAPRPTPSSLTLPALPLLLICWLNAIAITRWETHGHLHLAPSVHWSTQHFRRIGFVALLLTTIAAILSPATGLASSLSIAALLRLDAEPALTPLQRRSLADATLLTPLLVWPWLYLFGGA